MMTLKRLKGRGLTVDSMYENWIYDLEGDTVMSGFLFVDGWEDAKFMRAWYERNRDDSVLVKVHDCDLKIRLLGIEYDESGHYSSSQIKVIAECVV